MKHMGMLSAVVVWVAAGVAQAAIHNLVADLDGLQETPPVATPGFGHVDLTLDDVTGQVTLTSGSYAGLIDTVTASHIHGLAPVGTPAGVIFGLTNTGGTAGTLSGGGILTAAQITGMLNGETYVNVHTNFRPGGEIRGQILPEPASLLMLVLGGGAALVRRRR